MALEKITLEVTDAQTIHCGSCEKAVWRALSQLPGVRRVEASHRTQRIKLALDGGRSTLDEVRHRLEWMGYTAREVPE